MDRGTHIEWDGRPAVRFERRYSYPIKRLWEAITEPTELAHWFPSPRVSMQTQIGGTIELDGDPHLSPSTGTVLVFEPPHRLGFTWGGDELHFELSADADDSCRLILVDVLQACDAAARNAAGWSVCLAELDKSVAGRPGAGPHGDGVEPWQEHYDAYVAAGLPAGAAIPGGQLQQ